MTNRLEISWELDGFIDEQRYYCSETPIDKNALPAPKAIIANHIRSYVDNVGIVQGKTYYIYVSAVRGTIEKLSELITVVAKEYSRYTAYFELNNLKDKKGGQDLEIAGGVQVVDNSAYFNGASSYLMRPDTEATTFRAGNLTVECEFKCEIIGTHSNDQVLVDNFNSGGWQIALKANGAVYLYLNSPNVTAISSTKSYSDGNWHKLKWTRGGNLNTLYVDGVSVGTYIDQRDFLKKSYVAIGAQVNSRNPLYDFKGWIRNVGYAKQVL